MLASVLLASTAASFAKEGESFRYGIEGNNLVFTSPGEAISGGSVRLAVKGGQKASISVELVDVFSDESGTKRSIPLDSSPFTPKGLVQFKKSYPGYEPSEEFQYFDIGFNFKEDVLLDRPVLGGLSISLVPDAQSSEQTVVQSSIVATFAYLPTSGLNLEEYAPALTLLGPTIDLKTPDYFPLNLLPNLPFVLNHGDLTISYQLRNTGKIFLETATTLGVQQLGFFSQPDEEVFTDTKTVFLVPNQEDQGTIEIARPNSENELFGIGLYRFTLSSQGQIGEVIGTSTSNQQTLLIFPWKQSLIAVVLLIVFRRRLAKGFKWLVGYAKALRDFRYGKDPNPKLVPGPNPDMAGSQPKTSLRSMTPTSSLAGTSPLTKYPTINPPSTSISAPPKTPISRGGENRPLYPFWYEPPGKGDQP